ncbi:MAG: methylenetetrahydrofolate reductase C-terminal domain-containing protein [Methylobacteriaceae bacterium]|nr:methylenetetrahydrofolate reductase C-terminal domain-containing protein [Methylobacteriaceae bacterium]
MLTPLERGAKQVMFDCRMCGTCVLRKTGMACPTNCGKAMRNGPCGGVRADGGCEVDPAMRCVWLEARDGMRRISQHGERTDSLPPIDFSRRDRSTWIEVIDGAPAPIQPSAPQPRARPVHAFEAACNSGRFVTTVEIAPPDSADPAALLARAAIFAGLVDAMNITDGAGGNCHMSSAAAAIPLRTATRRSARSPAATAIALPCKAISSAAALGVRNILCLTGDDVSQGDHPQAKPVFDLDAVNLLRIARDMRDKGEFASGRKLETPPDLFIGATANPFCAASSGPDRQSRNEDRRRGAVHPDAILFRSRPVPPLHGRRPAARLHRRAHDRGRRNFEQRQSAALDGASCSRSAHPDSVLARIAQAGDQRAEGLAVLAETIRKLRDRRRRRRPFDGTSQRDDAGGGDRSIGRARVRRATRSRKKLVGRSR